MCPRDFSSRFRSCGWRLFVVSLGFIAAIGAHAQQRQNALLIGQRLTAANDLPSNTAVALARTSDDLLWVGTLRGLVRWDGSTMQPIPLTGSGLSSTVAFRTLFADSRDRLWASTEEGLTVLHHGKVLPGEWQKGWPKPADGLVWVESWAELPSGDILVTTHRGSYYRYDGRCWQPFPAPAAEGATPHLLIAQGEEIWTQHIDRFYRLQDQAWQPIETPFPTDAFCRCAPARDGGFWLLSRTAISHFARGQWSTPITLQNEIKNPSTFAEDSTGQLWVATSTLVPISSQSGVLRLQPDTGKFIPLKQLPNKVRALLRVGQGTIWVGSIGNGLIQAWPRGLIFQSESVPGGIPGLRFFDMIRTPDGRMIVGTTEKGAFIVGPEGEFIPASGPRTSVSTLALDPGGDLWTGSSGGGVERWRLDAPTEPTLSILPPDQVARTSALLTLPDSTLLIAHETGIHEWTPGQAQATPAELPPAAQGLRIQSLIAAGPEAYAGGQRGLLLHRNASGQWAIIPAATPFENTIDGLAIDDENQLWATASQSSLLHLHEGSLVSVPVLGLVERRLTADALTITAGRLWVAAGQHILSIQLAEARSAARGQGPAPARYYGGSNVGGMSPLRLSPQHAVSITPEGRPCFATYDSGFLLVNTHEPPPPAPLQPRIAGLRIGDQSQPIDLTLLATLPPRTTSLVLRIEAPDVETPEPCALRHRLSDDSPWRDASGHEINLNDLTPGSHQLQIQAQRLGTAWDSAVTTTWDFTIRPAWWQTLVGKLSLLFGTLALLTLASLGITRRRLRHHQTQLQHEATLLASREHALSQSTLFRHLLDTSADSIIIFDPANGQISDANTTAQSRLSRPGQLLIGTPIQQLGPDWPDHLQQLRTQTSLHFETTHLDHTTHQTHPAEVAMRLATSPSGHPFGIVISRDTTARQAALEHAQSLQQQLQESQKLEAVGHLAGGVAHDFNNILQIIHSCIDMIRSPQCAEPRRQQHLEQISLATDRAAQLTGQLLAFGRRAPVESALVDLRVAVPQSLAMIRRLIGTHIEVSFESDPDLPLIQADPVQIDQILMNLAVNARDALPTGGHIRVQARTQTWGRQTRPTWAKPGPWIMLRVTDDGHGMDEATRARVFEPFFTTKPIGKGTGLGLSVVYGVVHSHSGHVQIESAPGTGTSVTIFFPAIPPRPDDAAATVASSATLAHPVPITQHRRAVILFADDDPSVRTLTLDMLRDAGHEVIAATNGHEAIAAYQQHAARIDLVILDVLMPELTGTEAAARIRQLSATVPIIFCSGYTGDEALTPDSLPAHTRVLFKPYGADQLLSLIDEVRPLLPPRI